MATMGVIPLCEKGLTTQPNWVTEFVQMLEREGVESVWMPEHVIMAEDYEPLYDYSGQNQHIEIGNRSADWSSAQRCHFGQTFGDY